MYGIKASGPRPGGLLLLDVTGGVFSSGPWGQGLTLRGMPLRRELKQANGIIFLKKQ